jgi:hypothetical protein
LANNIRSANYKNKNRDSKNVKAASEISASITSG